MATRLSLSQEKRVLLESFRKYGHLIGLSIVLSLFTAVFEVFSIGMLIPFLRNLSSPDSEALRVGVEWIDRYVLGADRSQLGRMYSICGVILLSVWCRSIFGYASAVVDIKSRALVVEDLRMRAIDQLSAVSLRFFSSTRQGELINSLTNEMKGVSHALNVATTTLSQSFMLLAYTSFMIWVSWQLSLVVIVFFILLALGLTRVIRSVRRRGRTITKANGRFTSLITEFIGGIRTVTAFNMQGFERERLRKATSAMAHANIETSRRSRVVQPLSQAVVGSVLVAIVVIATQFYVLPGRMDVAFLLAFLFALLRLMPAVHTLNGQRGAWASVHASIDNISQLVVSHDKPYLENGTRSVAHFQDALVLEGVSFAYDPDELVLEDIDLRIEKGQMTAVVGASGAGKSTLADLVPRFYDPTDGRLLLDGVDLREFDVASLRDSIAVVSQSTYIFNDTVSANISYGTPGVSEEEIREAARQANALGFIEDMAQGFDTTLGDRGVRLSGGQRQRIAIARALLRDPQILILDEATSALDSVSEKLVQESLERLMEGRTVIAIAHRLSTIENADHVVVLEEGRIVEQGDYDELIERKGQLWKYHSIQYQLA